MDIDPDMLEILEVSEQSLREVFRREAHVFTPWLARPENLARLSRAIGVDLYDMKREQSSGTFRVDGLARRRDDDALVVIENQFDRSDHDHLGKSLTYLAAFDAKLAIWMAETFADEHLQALRWLNDHTPPDIGFFGVRPTAVRIGDSPPALRFDVAARPNTAVKRAEAAKRSLDGSIAEIRAAYWPEFEAAMAGERELTGVTTRFGGRLGFLHLVPPGPFQADREGMAALAYVTASPSSPHRIGVGWNRAAQERDAEAAAALEALRADGKLPEPEPADFSTEESRRAAAGRHVQMVKPLLRLLEERLTDAVDPA